MGLMVQAGRSVLVGLADFLAVGTAIVTALRLIPLCFVQSPIGQILGFMAQNRQAFSVVLMEISAVHLVTLSYTILCLFHIPVLL